ncbi:hypothetical protein SO3561_08314 [Streptomyces olivochromogenes]|uniref:Uncharacterized protein n=2 Tax=Streptomyces olivochromogenes TaxID=1963 RepID=A0A250VRM5_STROL|nr:hypothetical protein SO3561_08314 [Streptomyces olivochromogenes]
MDGPVVAVSVRFPDSSIFERLFVAEGDRRRMRIELHETEPDEQSAAVLGIADYKAQLGPILGMKKAPD